MKYWKITNEKENHKGMQYTTGLNVDILPFNPSGDCKKGGIYFASKDILTFCDYGCWIREVTLPENEEIYENPGSPKKYKTHRVILGERMPLWSTETFKHLVENGADIHARNDCALLLAAKNEHLEVVKYLVENGADIHTHNDSALLLAAGNGHLEVVKYLVENGANIHADNDYVLCWAAESGHLEVVKYLVENSADIHTRNDCALLLAAKNGHLEVVKYLKSIVGGEK